MDFIKIRLFLESKIQIYSGYQSLTENCKSHIMSNQHIVIFIIHLFISIVASSSFDVFVIGLGPSVLFKVTTTPRTVETVEYFMNLSLQIYHVQSPYSINTETLIVYYKCFASTCGNKPQLRRTTQNNYSLAICLEMY